MQPIRIRVMHVIDSGHVISILGINLETSQPVSLHVDHRPFQAIWDSWNWNKDWNPIVYEGNGLIMNLEAADDDGNDGGESLPEDPERRYRKAS